MIKEAEKNVKNAINHIDIDFGIVNGSLFLLEQVGLVSEEKESTVGSQLTEGQKTVAEVRTILKMNICGTKAYKNQSIQATFQANQNINCGKI